LEFHEVWEIRCLLLSFEGVAIRMLAAGQVANVVPGLGNARSDAQPFITQGVFSVVRYPRYLGDYVIGLGVVLIPFVWWIPVIYSLAFAFYYKRIISIEDEQRRSKYGTAFEHWAARTPAIIPRLSCWRPATRAFSFRAALRHEHASLFVAIALHSSIEWLEHLILERRVMLEMFWLVLAVAGLAVYLILLLLEKHTHLLNVQRQS
jgi:hypothetical protein